MTRLAWIALVLGWLVTGWTIGLIQGRTSRNVAVDECQAHLDRSLAQVSESSRQFWELKGYVDQGIERERQYRDALTRLMDAVQQNLRRSP